MKQNLGSEAVMNQLWAYRKLPQVMTPSTIQNSSTVGGSMITISGYNFGNDQRFIEVSHFSCFILLFCYFVILLFLFLVIINMN